MVSKLINVLVTASSKGIGKFIASYLEKQGYKVLKTSRTLRGKGFLYLDFRDKESIEDLARTLNSTHTCIDAAVINTGNPKCEPCKFIDSDYEDWIEASKIYLAGPLYLAKLLIEQSIQCNRRLSLVFISAISVIEPMSYLVVADTVRSGLSRVAKIIAREYASIGIRANVLLLGSYKTPGAFGTVAKIGKIIGLDAEEAWRDLVVRNIPEGETGDPEDLARITEFLLFEARYINGTTIVVDGSMTRSVLI